VREYIKGEEKMKCPICRKEFGYYSLRKKAWVCRHCGQETPIKKGERDKSYNGIANK